VDRFAFFALGFVLIQSAEGEWSAQANADQESGQAASGAEVTKGAGQAIEASVIHSMSPIRSSQVEET
jgi:hypothetical protein